MKNADKKLWLQRAQEADELLDAMKASRQQVYEQLTSKTASYSGMGGTGSPDPHKMERLAELDEKIEHQQDEVLRFMIEIQEAIGTVPDLKQRTVLQLRYMNWKRFSTWDEIANKMHYGKRHTQTIHGQALSAIVIPERATE